LCILISRALKLEYPFYAAIAAIVAMQSSVSGSFKAGKNRMLGTFVGAIIGFVLSSIWPGSAILCALGIMMLIYVCNLLKWNDAIGVGGILVCAIMLNLDGRNPLIYSINRLIDTFIGIGVALLVNYFIVPPEDKKSEKV
jgi:uncharacterized membrane protein YgaE (UPF0421/DUF939 family)